MGQARNRGTYEQRKVGAEARQVALRQQMEEAHALAQALLTPEEKERRRKAGLLFAALMGYTAGALR